GRVSWKNARPSQEMGNDSPMAMPVASNSHLAPTPAVTLKLPLISSMPPLDPCKEALETLSRRRVELKHLDRKSPSVSPSQSRVPAAAERNGPYPASRKSRWAEPLLQTFASNTRWTLPFASPLKSIQDLRASVWNLRKSASTQISFSTRVASMARRDPSFSTCKRPKWWRHVF